MIGIACSFSAITNEGNREAFKGRATGEYRRSDGGDGIRDRHVFEAGAIIECLIPDGGDGIRDRHARKTGASGERRSANDFCAFRDGDRCETLAIDEGVADDFKIGVEGLDFQTLGFHAD